MSKIALSGNASGTGTLTIAAPNTNTDRTLTLPDEAGTIITSGVSGVSGVPVGRGAGNVSTNTAVGASALDANTTGLGNIAVGADALGANTTGNYNTAIGRNALVSNTTASNNTAYGFTSLEANTTGASNTAIGFGSLAANTTASNNTAVGYQAGYAQTTGGIYGGFSTYLGHTAGLVATGAANTLIGQQAGSTITTGDRNTILGRHNGNQNGLDIRTASNYIVLSDGDGNPRCFMNQNGSFYAPRVYADTGGAAANVIVAADGQIYRSTSSLKYKREVQDATHGLAEVLQLRPVTYKGKGANDGETVYGGLIAEEVHDVGLTEFVQYAADGTPDALAYGNMVSLCVKAIQELKAELDTVKAELADLKGQA